MVFRLSELAEAFRDSDETRHSSLDNSTETVRAPGPSRLTEIPDHVARRLIEVGRAIRGGMPPKFDEISSFRRYHSMNCKNREFWRRTTSPLGEEDVADLARGLTHVEMQLNWPGGSVSGVIWLFQELVRRHTKLELLDELSSWILDNTTNPYNPFGTQISLGATNYSEYRALSESRSQRIKKRVEADARLEERAKAERGTRRKMAAAGQTMRNTPFRDEIIQALNPLPVPEKLALISTDPTFPPQFFPTSVADAATQQIVDALPEEVRLNLARRLKGKRKGPWARLRTRILRSLGDIWNKEPWWEV